MLLDDECQAIADLDVIFENERLDAILGSSNTLPVETDRPLQQMLGLDALEDLPTISQGEADFQQAMMEGYDPHLTSIVRPLSRLLKLAALFFVVSNLEPFQSYVFGAAFGGKCPFWRLVMLGLGVGVAQSYFSLVTRTLSVNSSLAF